MKCNPDIYQCRSIRLKGYDYSQPWAYFLAICTQDRECLFGEVLHGEMRLNPLGNIARRCWLEIPDHFPHTTLDKFIIMPNHVHGIVWIVEKSTIMVGAMHADVRGRHAMPLHPPQNSEPNQVIEQFGKPVPGSIPAIVRAFKSVVTKPINAARSTPGAPIWQRNHYEHIVRYEQSLNHIRQYIAANPAR